MRALRHWLHRLQRPARYAQLDVLLKNQAWDSDELLHKQQQDFAAIAAHASANVPFYAGLSNLPLQNLPILSKDDVREQLDDLLDRNADRTQVKLGYTGGSTGKPLGFWYDEAKHELMRAGMMRGFMMSGWRPGQKVLYFWGARQDTTKGGVFGGGWQDVIAAEKTIAATQFDEASLHAWARIIQQKRPTLLYGYPSAMSELARFIVQVGMTMPNTLIGVYSTAEMLLDAQRDLMQRAFGCKVFNQYGCREVPNIAWECRHGHMHVFADLVLLESVRHEDLDQREEQAEDRLLVTSLTNRLMPFIRYDLGDSGRLIEGECACGSPFPIMEMGVCRHNDLIKTPGGKQIHPGVFNHLLDGLTQIRQFQWVQRELNRLELNLVCAEILNAETLARIEAELHAKVDALMQLDVRYVDEIPRSVSGKHRFVIGMD
jgi:phenylacetate-CoA ligase